MKYAFSLWLPLLVSASLCVASVPGHAQVRSEILLDIVEHCVDPSLSDYCSQCRYPRADAGCQVPAPRCGADTEVWALTPEFAAIRDIKMCGCPAAFVHGLALPRAAVRGVEDPSRPEGIWQFAWNASVGRIPAEQVALVVNPRAHRSQNQLHVHLVRLREDVVLAPLVAGYVSDLGQVWATAAAAASALGLEDYGVLVAQRRGGFFVVAVSADSAEDRFAVATCR